MKKLATLIIVIGAIILVAFTIPSEPSAPVEGKYVLVIHGGAGNMDRNIPEEQRLQYEKSLDEALRIGEDILKNGGSSLDAVEQVIRFFEEDSLFNSGRGAVLTKDKTAELDASIMSGIDLNCGAVASIKHVKHPISLARQIMTKSNHLFFVSEGAERLAEKFGLEMVENEYFVTQKQIDNWSRLEEEYGGDNRGTVGAVALDKDGNLAAGTSTGGTTYKTPGRVGDSPVINAGTYANNKTCAVSATGWGEKFIKNAVAFHISVLMEYKGMTLEEAANEMIFNKLDKGDGGVIAVDSEGNYAMPYSTNSMMRGVVTSDGKKEIKIWE